MTEDDSIRTIKGVGEKAEKLYEKLGIFTVGDLLRHYPRAYDEVKQIQRIDTLRAGELAAIECRMTARPRMKRGRLSVITAVMEDGSGMSVTVKWFNMPFMMKTLRMGAYYILRGQVSRRREGLCMEQPKIYDKTEFYNLVGKLRPIYPLTKGLTNNAVTKSVGLALSEVSQEEYLPADIRKRQNLIGFSAAVKAIHYPQNREKLIEGRKRLVFDEFFLYTLALKRIKSEAKQESEFVLMTDVLGDSVDSLEVSANEKKDVEVNENKEENLSSRLYAKVPFDLTNAQKKALDDVIADMSSGYVMSRLIQGDVGSGKTAVALLALLSVVEAGWQGALMVPTEVLAKQHATTFSSMLPDIKVEVLTGSMTAKEKREVKEKLKNGECDIVIGTHTLIQKGVEFDRLALVVTDEQHRFGVRQRESFAGKGRSPHVLAMSATPIPRTLALILYGDMDLSVIDEKPANRLPVKNALVNTDYRPNAYKFIQKRVADGEQVYIICPMVDESEESDLENVTVYAEQLRQEMPAGFRIDTLHGRMKSAEKDTVMERFSAHETDILVSTTVIEVGIDVPNATTMLIENAERFGLATLHQLRGRVGRGSAQSYCIFMMGAESDEARERLTILERSNDGFLVASEDLKKRGQGDLFGTLQSGEKIFELADIYEDAKVLEAASREAAELVAEDFDKLINKNKRLREKMEKYMGEVVL